MQSLMDLTLRELEILQLVITGKTNKAIAHEIYVSEKTVEFHLDNIYSKIGVRTRLLAGVWAIQHGLQIETEVLPTKTVVAGQEILLEEAWTGTHPSVSAR